MLAIASKGLRGSMVIPGRVFARANHSSTGMGRGNLPMPYLTAISQTEMLETKSSFWFSPIVKAVRARSENWSGEWSHQSQV